MNKKFSTLYAKNSQNKIKVWEIMVEGNRIITTHGLLEGKKVTKGKEVFGKNIGKKNETTDHAQAVLEAKSSYKKKKDQDYFEDLKYCQTHESNLPMLALDYRKRSSSIFFPAFVQKKLDGVRCLVKKSNNKIKFTSRGGKDYTKVIEYNIELIQNLKDSMDEGEILDGELYKHGWSLQKIVHAVKKISSDTLQLQFWIFDAPSYSTTFAERLNKFNQNRFKAKKCLRVLETITASDDAVIKIFHDAYVEEGYEGVIIRNGFGLYKWGQRSKDLQKYKKFLEDEFMITGFISENQVINGNEFKAIVFICKTDAGAEFKCRPKGTLEQRQIWWKSRDSFVGKMLTVRFFAYTDASQGKGQGVPQFPVGVTIRDYE